MLNYATWTELKIGEHFSIAGYDDLFEKLSATQARDHGCGLLSKPSRFARKGTKVFMNSLGAEFANLLKR